MGYATMHFSTVQDAAKALRKSVPPNLPVRIRKVPMVDHVGMTILREGKTPHYEIQLCTSLPENAAVLILLHEWAHALSWDKGGSDHGPEWGIAYARCWRAYIEDSKR